VAVPICRFARAYRCRRLRELAAWGHDEVAKQTYLGLRAHLRVCWPGVIVDGRAAAGQGGWLLAPPRGQRRSRQRPPPWLVGKRRRVETVIGQLTGRYQLKRVWARDAWHLWSRWLRKLLSHPMAVLLCQRAGLGSLQFADLITN
jgi:hypothetical protein